VSIAVLLVAVATVDDIMRESTEARAGLGDTPG
jgi:hypothetical protein